VPICQPEIRQHCRLFGNALFATYLSNYFGLAANKGRQEKVKLFFALTFVSSKNPRFSKSVAF